MARKPVVLVTGASGEMGHGLIHRVADLGTFDVLALDLRPLDPELARCCAATLVGDILDRHLLDRLMSEFEISVVFHLAALLSTRGEFVPETAQRGDERLRLGDAPRRLAAPALRLLRPRGHAHPVHGHAGRDPGPAHPDGRARGSADDPGVQRLGELLDKGIYVVGFSYPVVPQGAARIRVQISAAHEPADLEQAVAAFVEVGRAHHVI